jgi:hypothetical protein
VSAEENAHVMSEVVDATVFMTIATADPTGRPWAAPVFFATEDYRTYYWVSSPAARHSQDIQTRPEVAIVIFASDVRPGAGQAVYLEARAELVPMSDLAEALRAYPGAASRGGGRIPVEQLQPDSPYRMYRATTTRRSILCPSKERPCPEHGVSTDHRVDVPL